MILNLLQLVVDTRTKRTTNVLQEAGTAHTSEPEFIPVFLLW